MNFPDWGGTAGDTQQPARYGEWAVDWARGAFALRDGKPYRVSGAEAVQVWIQCALHPHSRRFACSAHSADYGHSLEALVGQSGGGVWEARLRREIRETLLQCPYITAVDGFSVAYQGCRAVVRFTVRTVYGGLDEVLEVRTA